MAVFTFRIPDNMHVQARVLAAFKNVSLNELCLQAVAEYLQQWEKKHGEIPLPPDNVD